MARELGRRRRESSREELDRSSRVLPDQISKPRGGRQRAMTDLLRALAVLGLVAANAFCVVAEYAIVTSRRAALRPRADAGHSGARAALRLMDEPVRVMSTVQVGITASGILIGAVGEPLVRELLGDWVPHGLGFSVAFLVVTYLSVVFGELAPKALTLHNAEAFSVLVAPAIELVAQILRPVVWLLEGSARVVLPPSRVRELVAGESIRSPVGIVHVRDLIAAARRRSAATVGELVRTAMVVSESKDL